MVIDPAIHFGRPEADLAMTRMYGIFPDAFYEGYRESHPLLPDREDRPPLYQLKELLLMIARADSPFVQRPVAVERPGVDHTHEV